MRFREQDLANLIAYLNKQLEATDLNTQQRLALQKQLSTALNQQYQLEGDNYSTAFSVAFRNIQNTQVNYAQIVEEAWNSMYSNLQTNLDNMALKGESATKALENFFQNMVQSIEEMFIKMWSDKYIMGPLEQLLGGLMGGGTNAAFSLGNGTQLSPTFGFNMSNLMAPAAPAAKAGGGDTSGLTEVGEEGPELAYFGDPAHIYTASRLKSHA